MCVVANEREIDLSNCFATVLWPATRNGRETSISRPSDLKIYIYKYSIYRGYC